MRPSPWCDRVPSATRMSSATLPGTGDVQKAHMETTQITTRRSLTWLHFGWLQNLYFLKGSEIDHFGGLGGPGESGDPSKRRGMKPPPFGRVSGAPGAAQTHKRTESRPLSNVKVPSQSTADSPAENLSEPSHGCHVSYSMRTVAHRSILAQGMLSQLWAGRRVETYPCPGLAEAQGLPTSRVPEGKMAASTPNIDDFRSFVGRFWGTFGHRRQWHGGFMGGSWSAMTTGKRAQIRKLWCTCLTATDLP
jgi:hypothetical protein